MDRWQGKVAIVTGASVGIGAAVVENLLDAKITVVGLARSEDKLKTLSKRLQSKEAKFYYHVTDVSKESDILEAFKWTKDNVGPVSILINNAGIYRVSNLIDGQAQFWRDVFETNVIGLSIATREAIQQMSAEGIDGHIININSILGHRVIPIPNIGIYTPSKYAVTALTESVKNELAAINSRIKITSISPGSVKTELHNSSYEASKEELTDDLKKTFESMFSLTPKDVADAVSYVLSTPPNVQINDILLEALF